MLKLRLTLDYLNYQWNRTVIVYDFEQQFELVRRAGKRLHGIDPAGIIGGWPYPVTIFLLGVLLYLIRNTTLFRRREERILRRFLRRIASEFGIDARQGRLGLFEIAGLVGNERVGEFAAIYSGAVYRDRRLTDREYRRLQQILREGFVVKASVQ